MFCSSAPTYRIGEQPRGAASYSPVQSDRSYSCGDSPAARGESSCSSISASRASRRFPFWPNRHWLQNCRLEQRGGASSLLISSSLSLLLLLLLLLLLEGAATNCTSSRYTHVFHLHTVGPCDCSQTDPPPKKKNSQRLKYKIYTRCEREARLPSGLSLGLQIAAWERERKEKKVRRQWTELLESIAAAGGGEEELWFLSGIFKKKKTKLTMFRVQFTHFLCIELELKNHQKKI